MCTETWNQTHSLTPWEGTSVSHRLNQLRGQHPAWLGFQEACQRSWEQEGWGSHIHTRCQTDQFLTPSVWNSSSYSACLAPANRNLDVKAVLKQQILQICTSFVNVTNRFWVSQNQTKQSLDLVHVISCDVPNSLFPLCIRLWKTHWERSWQN